MSRFTINFSNEINLITLSTMWQMASFWGASVADPGGGPGGPAPPSPHFWGPRLYSEAQIAPFYTQITEKFSKRFCLASLGIQFQFSIDIFWSKTLENYPFWGPRLYSEAQITPFYTQITENVSKNFASLRSAYYFNYQLTYFNQRH